MLILNKEAKQNYNEEIMKNVYNAGADGMTVNFPDRLTRYIEKITEKQ